MKRIRKQVLLMLGIGALVCFWHTSAEATRSFTIAQTPASIAYAMGTAQTVTFQVTNNSTAGETITAVRFNVSNTYTTLPNPETFNAPTGWACARSSNTRITCTANSATYYITPTNFQYFAFNINSAALSTDRTTGLSSANAQFYGSGTWRTPNSTTSSWTWQALLMNLVPAPSNVGSGCTFTLTMTVTNKSTANGLIVTSVPSPRTTAITAGGATVNNPSPVPASLTLNTGATGTIVWNYTLSGPANGTVTFTACASSGGSCTTVSGTSRTSNQATTSAVTINTALSCIVSAAITNNPPCLFSGGTASFAMIVTNGTSTTVTNVVPSALTRFGPAVIGAFTGPVPASIPSIAIGGNGTFTWTAPVTGNPNDQYSVSGYATANGPITTPTVTSTPVQDIDGYVVSNAGPTNAGSTNADLTWTVTNYGCSNINQVAIAVPGGWPSASNWYSLVNNTVGSAVQTWTVAGTTFTSDNATDRIPPTGSPPANTGTFHLVFSPTAAAGTYTFNVTITDDTTPVPHIITVPTTVTVNPFGSGGSGGLNSVNPSVWHEDVR